jgi:20S proteasome subunit beta 7
LAPATPAAAPGDADETEAGALEAPPECDADVGDDDASKEGPATAAADDDHDHDHDHDHDAAAAAVVRDAVRLNAQNLHKYLGRFMYRRRSDFDPLWNQMLVAGLDGAGRPFLSSVDLLGTTFSAPTLATGFGAHLAQPILRRLVDDEAGVARVERAEAEAAVRECMKVLFYRDARSLDRYSLAVVTCDGVELSFDEKLDEQSWAFAEGIRGYGTQTQ